MQDTTLLKLARSISLPYSSTVHIVSYNCNNNNCFRHQLPIFIAREWLSFSMTFVFLNFYPLSFTYVRVNVFTTWRLLITVCIMILATRLGYKIFLVFCLASPVRIVPVFITGCSTTMNLKFFKTVRNVLSTEKQPLIFDEIKDA